MRKYYLSIFFYFLACQNATQKTSDLRQSSSAETKLSILNAQAQCVAPDNIWDDTTMVCKANMPMLSDFDSCATESGTWINDKCYKRLSIIDQDSAICQYSDPANVWDSVTKICYKPPIFASDKNSCEKQNGTWENNICYTKITVSPYTSTQCLSINENNKFIESKCYQPIGVIDSDATCVEAGGKWFTSETNSSCYKVVDIEKSLTKLCNGVDATNIFQDNKCYATKMPMPTSSAACTSDGISIWNDSISPAKCLLEIALMTPNQSRCLKTVGNSWDGSKCMTKLTMATDSDTCSTQGGTWKVNICYSIVQQVTITQAQCNALGISYKWVEDQSTCFQVVNIVDPKTNDSSSAEPLKYSDNSAVCKGMSTALSPLMWDSTSNQCYSLTPVIDVSANNSSPVDTKYADDISLCALLSDSIPSLWVDTEHKCYTGLVTPSGMTGAQTTQSICKAQNPENVFVESSIVASPQLGSCYAPISPAALDINSCTQAVGTWLTTASLATQGCYKTPDNITTQSTCETPGAAGKWITTPDGVSKCYSQSSITNIAAVCQNFNGKSVFGVTYPGIFNYDSVNNTCLYQPYSIPDPIPPTPPGPITYAACPMGKIVVGYKEGTPKTAIQCDDFNKIQLAASRFNTCAIVQGKYYCWGRTDFVGNVGTALGQITAEKAIKPQQIKVQKSSTDITPITPPIGSTLYSMAMGRWNSCMIFNGQSHCSGKAFMGIDLQDRADYRRLHNIGGYSTFVKKIASYDVTSCEITSDNTTSPANKIMCWGDNHFEQSGIPTLELKCFAESSSNSNYVLFPSINSSSLIPVCVTPTPGFPTGTFADNYSTLTLPTVALPNTTAFQQSFNGEVSTIYGPIKHTWNLQTVAEICASATSGTGVTTEFGADGLTTATEDTNCYKKFVNRNFTGGILSGSDQGFGGYSNPITPPSAASGATISFGPDYSTISLVGDAETPLEIITPAPLKRPWWWSYYANANSAPDKDLNLNNASITAITLQAGQEFIDLAVGSHHVCAVVKTGALSDSNPTPYEIQCRGKMSPMGLASAGSTPTINVVQESRLFTSKLTKTIALAAAPKQLILGNDVTCYIDSNDKLWCAGGGKDYFKTHASGYVNLSDASTSLSSNDNAGFLFNATATDTSKIAGFGPVQKVAIGQQFICALTKEYTSPTAPAGNKLKCVGKAASHPYAYSVLSSTQITTPATALSQIQDFTSQVYPSPIAGQLNPTLVDIAAGTFHACVADQSQVYCWGKNDWNQLGIITAGSIATTGATPIAADTPPVLGTTISPVTF